MYYHVPRMKYDIPFLLMQKNTRFHECFDLVRQWATLPGPGWVQVPSLLMGLTAVFGMGTGVTPPLQPPATQFQTWTSIVEC